MHVQIRARAIGALFGLSLVLGRYVTEHGVVAFTLVGQWTGSQSLQHGQDSPGQRRHVLDTRLQVIGRGRQLRVQRQPPDDHRHVTGLWKIA